MYSCLLCSESFTKPSDLRTHENMHTSKQSFICDFPGCAKRFGVGSNLQRHKQVAHGIQRAHRDRSVLEYKFKFEPLSLSPTLISDTTPMASEIAWDNEGPFSRRSVHWPGLQTIADSGGK
ncbi:hypothetical protein B0H14DRAFT_2810612 [Mycena olivaceomarginata]|nr:hypothetical protein B0H14DRAFT_2810612 [Mycena olivaceomarginata]